MDLDLRLVRFGPGFRADVKGEESEGQKLIQLSS